MSVQERLVAVRTHRLAGKASLALLKLLGIELPPEVSIGAGLRLPHGAVGLVVHPTTVLGEGVVLYQGVTIGRSDTWMDDRYRRPGGGGVRIGSGAVVGAGAAILFKSGQDLSVGEGSVIGANAVVLGDVPDGEIWAGVPARRIASRSDYAGQLKS